MRYVQQIRLTLIHHVNMSVMDELERLRKLENAVSIISIQVWQQLQLLGN